MYPIQFEGKVFTEGGRVVPPEGDKCGACGNTLPEPEGIVTGYGLLKNAVTGKEEKICYDCMTEMEKDSMERTGRAFLYYNEETQAITNFIGRALGGGSRIVRKWKDNTGGERWAIRFYHNGTVWAGAYYRSAGDYMWCKVTKLKGLYD
jgi:hypothetical protein